MRYQKSQNRCFWHRPRLSFVSSIYRAVYRAVLGAFPPPLFQVFHAVMSDGPTEIRHRESAR
jgi:hypothetical protein